MNTKQKKNKPIPPSVSEEASYRLAAIVESSDDAIVSKTLNGIITSWNKSAEKLFGYTADEAIGQHINLIIPLDHRHEEIDIINKIRKGIRIEHFETIRQRKDKKLILVSLSISAIKDNKGKIIGASKIARDITEKKRAEKELKENEQRLRLALNAGNIGVWDWDIKNDILTWTDNVYTIHGVDKNTFQVSYENYSKRLHPDDKPSIEKAIKHSLDNKLPYNNEFRIVTPSGEVRWVSTRATITYENDKPVRMLGATSDITKRKKLDQEKNDFLSMASHELKTPLTSMKLFIDLLTKEINKMTAEKPKYYINRILDQTNKLSELTNDLLDVSRIENGKLRLKKELFNLDTLVEETVLSITPSTSKHTMDFNSKHSVPIVADKYRIYQVIVNLLTNAIKYSPDDGNIIITVDDTSEGAVVSVKDFGIGIKKEEQTRIFERLYQVGESNAKTYPGLGLGLYISKEIIERHNGKLWVISEKGKGSTFYFSLPTYKNFSL